MARQKKDVAEKATKKATTKKVTKKEPENIKKEHESIKKEFVEIRYNKLVTSVDANNVKKELDKAGYKDYLYLELNDCERTWLREKGIRSEFAVIIPDGEDKVILTTWRSALAGLKQYGKI